MVDEATLTYTNISEAGDIERIASLIIGFWNRNFLGFGGEGNKTKRGNVIKEPANELYVEVLKGRHIGTGMSSVFEFDGNIRKIDFDKGRDVEKMIKYNESRITRKDKELFFGRRRFGRPLGLTDPNINFFPVFFQGQLHHPK